MASQSLGVLPRLFSNIPRLGHRISFTDSIRPFRPISALLGTAIRPGLITIFASWGSSIWDNVLRAVPKKKTSYSKKRKRFLHNNTLTDITHVVSCPACGTPKKMHTLCPYCVEEIRQVWKSTNKSKAKTTDKQSGSTGAS